MRREPRTLDTRLLGLFPSPTASLGELPVQSVRPYTQTESARYQDAHPTNGYSHTSAEASRVLRFRASEFRTTVLKGKNGNAGGDSMMRRPDATTPYPCAESSRTIAGEIDGVYPAPQFDTAIQRSLVASKASLVWSGREDSNLRPLRPERSALPGCATPRQNQQNHEARRDCLTSGGRNASHEHRPPLDR